MVPGAHMNSSPQGPIQRPRGRRNPLLRSDFSGSGKTREQGAAEGREGAKSRVRPRPPLPKTRQHGAAPENAFTVAPESAQDVSTARSVPNNGGSGAAEPQAKKLILQGGPRAELLPAAIDQLWQANPLQKLLPIDWGAITQALSTLPARSMANPLHTTIVATKARWFNFSPIRKG